MSGEKRDISFSGKGPAGESGHITVFAALSFLIIMGISFLVLEGMREYQISMLEEDAVMGAGEFIKANYDKTLFERYHILLLDPRENDYMEKDAEEYFEGYYGRGSFFGHTCLNVLADERVSVTDEDGKILQHEIREWMKYKKIREAGSNLKECLLGSERAEEKAGGYQSEIGQTPDEGGGSEKAEAGEKDADSSESEEGENQEENVEPDPAVTRNRIRFKEIKETLEMVMKSGILYYAVDDTGSLSKLKVSLRGLPSRQEGDSGRKLSSREATFSFDKVSSLLNLFSTESSGELNINDSLRLLEDEYLTLGYLQDCFSSCVKEESPDQGGEDSGGDGKRKSALLYELEYMVCGCDSDLENLRKTVNRILLLRFATNYVYARTDTKICGEAKTMSACLTGVLGLPEAEKAVELLLIGALAYGESVLEIHALLNGDKAALAKNSENWNLTFANAAEKLRGKSPVKSGGKMISYEEYLMLLLVSGNSAKTLYYRMMDIMQLNVALEEPGFTMEKALFSFRLQAEFKTGKWFPGVPGFGLRSETFLRLKPERYITY